MKFKIGDRVRVTHTYRDWIFWMKEMNTCIGNTYTIVGEWESMRGTFPTIVIEGYNNGISGRMRVKGEYAIHQQCLELAIKPGEQLLFSFMND